MAIPQQSLTPCSTADFLSAKKATDGLLFFFLMRNVYGVDFYDFHQILISKVKLYEQEGVLNDVHEIARQ